MITSEMIIPITLGIVGLCGLGVIFWLGVSQVMFEDEQAVKQELHEQNMRHGTNAKGGATCLRKALDI